MQITDNGLARLPMHQFIIDFGRELPKLVALLKSDTLRKHPRWGNLLPYHLPTYGDGPSPGHCVRPDIVLTKKGPIICEIDFVASGRAHLIESLRDFPDARAVVLKSFALWYEAMHARSVLYGTGSRTSCFKETEIFSEAMRRETSIDIRAVNLDTVEAWSDTLVDRLSYRSELVSEDRSRQDMRGYRVSTAEPYLDSKAISVLVHDLDMTDILTNALGKTGLQFWRRVMPLSFFQKMITPETRQIIWNDPSDWVIKSTDVESDTCWGCRGTIMGRKYRAADIKAYLESGKKLGSKDPGQNPLVQRCAESIDFRPLWDSTITTGIGLANPASFGRESDISTTKKATTEVFGRVGFFLPFTKVQSFVSAAAFGEVVMRQGDPLVHGASDAIAVGVEFV